MMVVQSRTTSEMYKKPSGKEIAKYANKTPEVLVLTKSNDKIIDAKPTDSFTVDRRAFKFHPAHTLRGPVFSRKPKFTLHEKTKADKPWLNTVEDTKTENELLLDVRRPSGTSNQENLEGTVKDLPNSDYDNPMVNKVQSTNGFLSGDSRQSRNVNKNLPVIRKTNENKYSRQEKLLSKRVSYQTSVKKNERSTREIPSHLTSGHLSNLSPDTPKTANREMKPIQELSFPLPSCTRRTLVCTGITEVNASRLPEHEIHADYLLWRRENMTADFVTDEAIRKSIKKCKAWILRYWEYF